MDDYITIRGMFDGQIMGLWSQNNLLHNALIDYCRRNEITVIYDLLTSKYRSAVELNIPIPGVRIKRPLNDPRGHKWGKWLGWYL
jgi:hypothetical protein